MHLVLWLEIALILVDVQLVVCYNAGNHEATNEFAAADTTGVTENVKGARTTSSIVAKNRNSALLIGSDIPKTIHGLKHLISRTFGGPQTLCVLK
jgi:hypothetical protein